MGDEDRPSPGPDFAAPPSDALSPTRGPEPWPGAWRGAAPPWNEVWSAPDAPAQAAGGSDRRVVVSWIWALSPLISAGFSTPITFAIAAYRTRKLHFQIATVFYTTLVVLGFALPESIGFVCWDLNWIMGAVHALVVRSRAFPPPRPQSEQAIESAMKAVKERRELRRKAREIVAGDPGLARELGIGRPDLDRTYDDGGLVDVNTAPAAVLTQLQGITPELADRIIRIREARGPYRSVEDLSVFADLPPALTDALADRLLFVR
jgi:DNA uptake protein ComE-like DNA-binding protein